MQKGARTAAVSIVLKQVTVKQAEQQQEKKKTTKATGKAKHSKQTSWAKGLSLNTYNSARTPRTDQLTRESLNGER